MTPAADTVRALTGSTAAASDLASVLDDDFRARATADFDSDIADLCAQLTAAGTTVDTSMARFIEDFFAALRVKGSQRVVSSMVALPLLTHGAETGQTEPARPLAVIHLLWWSAARYLDDLIDAQPSQHPDRPQAAEAETNKRILTAIGVGSHLTTRVIAQIPASGRVRARLTEEVSRCWLDAIGGQISDLSDDPLSATPASIERSYRGKTGAPYAMATTAAACLAEADPRRIAGWHEFGQTFGLLRQFVNDQRDLATGRNEDLRNGTATYLLAVFLRALPEHQHSQATDLLDAARTSPDAVSELSAWMLRDDMIERYADAMTPTIRSARQRLDALGGEPDYIEALHGLIDETVSFFPTFRLLRD